MSSIVDTWTLVVAEIITAIAAALIAVASVEAAIGAVIAFTKAGQLHIGIQHIRWRYGRWLTLGLDFLIAGDILRTAIEPGWTEIGQLAAIVLLRTLITMTLSREIKEEGAGTA